MKELQIVYKNISELNPYKNNPRFNDEAVEAVAKTDIEPYIKLFNNKSMEIAKKYNMKPKKITFAGFIR